MEKVTAWHPDPESQHRQVNSPLRSSLKQFLAVFLIVYGAITLGRDVLNSFQHAIDRFQGYASHDCKGHHHLPPDGQVDMNAVPIGELIPHQCWTDSPGNQSPKELKCYRMAAPLDYNNQSDSRRANIAIGQYPAGGGKTPRSEVLGSVIFNPGGPGGSGIDFITRFSDKYNGSSSAFFDAIFESKYDIVSFDPRGVQRTWPRADCFNDTLESYADDVFSQGSGLLHSSSSAAAKTLAHNDLLAELCQLRLGDVLPHVTTAAVVKDLHLMHKALGDKKLNYAGFSYGTVLGSYFADIFPEFVGHFWLDGVVDVFNYQEGVWDDNLVDFEKVLKGFFTTCVDAGPEHCALATSVPKSIKGKEEAAQFLQTSFNDQIESLRTKPVPVAQSDFPGIATYYDYKAAYFHEMYTPSGWPQLANISLQTEEQEWAPFMNANGLKKYVKPLKGSYTSPEATHSIGCADSMHPTGHWDLAQYVAFEKAMEKQSPFAAEHWSAYGAMCEGAWKIRGADLWRGSFNSTPANPILFASNTYDPVTPLREARKMQKSFGGPNKLLHVQDGYGHCTIALTSRCGQKTVADWFVRDKLPEEDEKICHLEAAPFLPQPPAIQPHEMQILNDQEKLTALANEAAKGVADIFQASFGDVNHETSYGQALSTWTGFETNKTKPCIDGPISFHSYSYFDCLKMSSSTSTNVSRPSSRLVGVSTKMYFDIPKTTSYLSTTLSLLPEAQKDLPHPTRVFFLPDFVTLQSSVSTVKSSHSSLIVGAQHTHHADSGAFTGEVSPKVLAQAGAQILEIGHAERRKLFGETDAGVVEKSVAAARNGLTPLICVGEISKEGGVEKAVQECWEQVSNVFAQVPKGSPIILAYEPVWAIGASQPATPSHVVAVTQELRRKCAQEVGWTGDDLTILYGGSAGPGTFGKIQDGVDGLFLGRFAHDPQAFARTIEEVGGKREA
ncbi:unnamed protein product [Sympodiomycopsis kandeliae]